MGKPVSTVPVIWKGASEVSVVIKNANNVPIMTARALRPNDIYLHSVPNLPFTSFIFYNQIIKISKFSQLISH